MKQSDNAQAIGSGMIANLLTQRFTDRTIRLFEDSDRLKELSIKLTNVAKDKSQGHIFEQLEVIKFNLDALKKDSDLYAKTTSSMGMGTDPVDIVIKNGSRTIREIQAKSCSTAAASTFQLSQEKYNEMARLAPVEQNDKIKELLDKRIASGTLKAEEYEQTRRNLIKTLRHDNVESSGTTYNEAVEATSAEGAQSVSNSTKLKAACVDMHESGLRGGLVGAGISGSISAISNVYKLSKDEAEIGDVLASVSLDAGKGFLTGYAVTAASKGITHVSHHFMGAAISKALTKANAPVAIASGVITAGKSLISYMKGDINSEQLLSEINHTTITCAASFYYGALGQVVIPIPILGAMVGAGVGYIIGNLLHQSSLLALGECSAVTEAKERRREIEAMCLALIPKIQKERYDYEMLVEKHFSDRRNEFVDAFTSMDASWENDDPQTFIHGLGRILSQFGGTLNFKTFEEFDDFMMNSEQPLKL